MNRNKKLRPSYVLTRLAIAILLNDESLIPGNKSLILAHESLILAHESLILANESLSLANESLTVLDSIENRYRLSRAFLERMNIYRNIVLI